MELSVKLNGCCDESPTRIFHFKIFDSYYEMIRGTYHLDSGVVDVPEKIMMGIYSDAKKLGYLLGERMEYVNDLECLNNMFPERAEIDKCSTYSKSSPLEVGQPWRWDINLSSILSLLIKEAAKCGAYASDLFISWNNVIDYMNQGSEETRVFLFGFRDYGVDHADWVYKRIQENPAQYRRVLALTCQVEDNRLVVTFEDLPVPEEALTDAWYIEKWTGEDLVYALSEAEVPVTPENIKKLRELCLHIFDDKSERNEMLVEAARGMAESN